MRTLRNLMRRLRRFKLIALLLGVPALAFMIYAMLIEPRMVEVTQHDISIDNLPSEFDGLRIVHLTDIHQGLWMSHEDVQRIVALTNSLKPDAVVITGDLVTRLFTDIPRLGRALGEIQARHGVYAVLGNHDYWEDEDAITEALIGNGIDVLFDESRTIRIGEGTIRIVGTDDLWGGSPNFDKAFEGIEERDVAIALAHTPDSALFMNGMLADLTLTGHTHGGLLNIPGYGAVLSSAGLGRKYVSGLHEINGVRVYISRGLARGTTLAPFRFRCRPEIAVFTLRQVGNKL